MIIGCLLRDEARCWLLSRHGVELSEVTMPAKRYKVTLEPDERGDLGTDLARQRRGPAAGPCPYRAPRRSGQGKAWQGRRRDRRGGGGERGDYRAVRQRFVEEELEAALSPRPLPRLDPAPAPEGRGRGSGLQP
jgi:hypothetical protein